MDAQRLNGGVAPAAEHAARTSYGRLVALLTASSGDLQLAEDCLSTAFVRALETWPESGVPENPEGWLLTVARNQQRDAWRSAAHRLSVPLQTATETAGRRSPFPDVDLDAIPDKRLELLFVCAHPDIAPDVRAPLMLQAVLGFEAAHVARVFAVPTATMAQRLVRAKRRIKNSSIGFVVPDRGSMPQRLAPVLEAVYGCYAIAWSNSATAGALRTSMAGEARDLAVTLATLLGDHPEAWGLAALITLSMSRAPGSGRVSFVALEEQDPTTWDRVLIDEGERYLHRASAADEVGRFQLEAAIQAVHLARARTGVTDYRALRTLYTALDLVAPTIGSKVALASTIARTDGTGAGLSALDELADAHSVLGFQPYWAVRGHLLADARRLEEAAAAYRTAVALSPDEADRAYLERQLRQLQGTRAEEGRGHIVTPVDWSPTHSSR